MSLRGLVAAVAFFAAIAPGSAWADALEDVRLGARAYGEGRFADAVAAFDRAIESRELSVAELAVTLNNRGVARGALGRFDEAVEDHREALQLTPDDPTTKRNLQIAYDNRGFARFGSGDYEGALEDYDASLELDSGNALAYARRGVLLMELGRDAEAIADLEGALAIDPSNDKARAALDLARSRLALVERAGGRIASVGEEVAPAAGDRGSEELGAVALGSQEEVGVGAERVAGSDAPALAVVEATPGARLGRIVSAVNYRAGPGNDFDRLGTLDANTLVAIVGEERRWKEILFSDGRRAFVFERFVAEVD